MNVYHLRIVAELHFQKVIYVFELVLFLAVSLSYHRLPKMILAFAQHIFVILVVAQILIENDFTFSELQRLVPSFLNQKLLSAKLTMIANK